VSAAVEPGDAAIYGGWVRHRRFVDRPHAFRLRLFYPLLDLERLEETLAGLPLWSSSRPAPVRFVRRHFLGDPGRPLAEAVRDRITAEGLPRPAGPVRLLGQLQTWGYCFNPVVFYFCYDEADRRVEAIVAEITNTPWGERRSYVFSTAGQAVEGPWVFEFDKDFHVSPFLPLDLVWRWRFSAPGRGLTVHMENLRRGQCIFDATLRLKRRPLSRGQALATLLRWPAMTAVIHLGIYWQALRLWLKGATFHPHPGRRKPTEGDAR
jgi:uncharacterized protein